MTVDIESSRVVNLLEIKEWSNLKHPNVLRLLDMIFNVDGVVIFMTELMQTNLFMRLQDKEFKREAQAPEKCRQYARQVMCGLAYMHQSDLCHLDLRAENVFIAKDGRAVVADFSGLCRKTEMKKFCPLPHSLRPPEMLTSKKKVAPMPVDLWACGLLLANLFLGKGFYICTVKNQKAGHIDAVLQYTGLFRCQNYVENFFTQTYPNSSVSEGRLEEMMSLMNMFLQIDPELRIATEEALKHSFLSFSPEKTGAVILESKNTSGTLTKANSSLSADTAAEDTESPNLDVKFLQHSTGAIKPKTGKWQKYKFRFGKLRLNLLAPPVSSKTEKAKTEEPQKMNKSSAKVFFKK
ncbi:uncharacterized protein LOC129975717 isoform X1 [Argiope bruennichi]|uniref:uncharacterized protein LOC129975717 isoform X1 n=1 Tax=Argiope bruennichi TaxID=94029 RepID=UPI0024950F13|nr:uncharacterized protein LOC129975717 isoform X1 [Argiope bruennichi]